MMNKNLVSLYGALLPELWTIEIFQNIKLKFSSQHSQYLQIISRKEAMAVFVKITKVVDPKTLWAYETDSGYREIKLKMVERELEDQWPEAEEILMISAISTEPVIVQVEEKFHRGEIQMVRRGPTR